MRYLLAIAGVVSLTWAQEGVRIGGVLCPQVTSAKGEMDKDYVVVGLGGGVSVEKPFTEYAAVGGDILFSFAGWRQEDNTFVNAYAGRTTHRISTLQIPLYVRTQWLKLGREGGGLSASVGIQSDILLSSRVRLEQGSALRNASSYSKFAGSLLAGLGFSQEGDHVFSVEVRSSYSFINIKSKRKGRINPAWFMLRAAYYFSRR
ncbi:MAG: PorT family protein [Bacteroidia bacterium]|nr:PorT family protein [Bacteroidia bacterium]MDW8235870.1 outer membrane beta-barrel protein [Bacteroidia bacterium]